jgi:hypothetical protein
MNVIQNIITNKIFFEEMVNRFPEMEKELFDKNDLTIEHYDMARLAELSIKNIGLKNWVKLKQYFDYLEKNIPNLSSDLIVALEVSYCEHIFTSELNNDQLNEAVSYMNPLLYSLYYNRKAKFDEIVKAYSETKKKEE